MKQTWKKGMVCFNSLLNLDWKYSFGVGKTCQNSLKIFVKGVLHLLLKTNMFCALS